MADVNAMMRGGEDDDGGAMMVEERGRGDSSRGVKRNASDNNLSDFPRFEKRLRALSIRSEEQRIEKHSTPKFHKRVSSKNGILSTGYKRPAGTQHDGMEVDDTRNRVYIADIDAELADVSSDGEKLIFLPDIEKKLNRLPRQVYEPRETDGHDGQELVLYTDPTSLTVDPGHDSVRKAIVEARQRAREKAIARQEDMDRMYHASHGGDGGMVETAHGYNAGYMSPLRLDSEHDPDAMDLG